MTKKIPKPEPEIEPGAWKRFESAIDALAKSPPQHKVAKKPADEKRAQRTTLGSEKRKLQKQIAAVKEFRRRVVG